MEFDYQGNSSIERLNPIIRDIKDNRCIIFIGAGISNIAGCYVWDSVVKELLSLEIIKERLKPVEEIYKSSSRLSNEELIYFCKQELSHNGKENEFWGIVRKALLKDYNRFQTQYLPLITKLREIVPFPPIITTNIDNCLEEAGIVDLNKVFYKLNDFKTRNLESGSIFHIHGYIEKLEDALLTKKEYLPRYRNNKFRSFLKSVFSNYSFLFIGYGLGDREIKDIILEARKNRKHFILVSSEDTFSSSERYIFSSPDMWNIEIINYGPRDRFPDLMIRWINKNFPKEIQLSKEEANGQD